VLDIYRFFRINQTWGRGAGDAVLIELARRLRALGGHEMLARVGADSFAVLLHGPAATDWRGAVESMIKSLREPFVVGPAHTRKLSASVGCALYPQDTGSVSSLLGLAEAAVFSSAERELARQSEQLDPYGAQAADKMAWLQRFLGNHLPRLNSDFVEQLCACDAPERAQAAELPVSAAIDLLPTLERYVELLLAPQLQERAHREHAARLGRLQAARGVPAQVGMRAMSRLYQSVAGLAQRIPARLSERLLYLGTLLRRMEADIAHQDEGAEQLRLELLQGLHDATLCMQATQRRADLLDAVVSSASQLPFVVAATVHTQDAEGSFVLEAQVPRDAAWMGEPAAPLAPRAASSPDDSLQRCWLSADIEMAPDVLRHARREQAWAQRLLERDVRAVAAVPVVDGAGHVLLVLKLYGRLPGQFSTPLMRHAIESLRFLIAAELARVGEDIALPAVAADERSLWRQRLFGGGLCMLMQPIVDLRQGACTRVEALARLQLDADTLLSPARFLPILGQHELDRLFLEGLRLSLQVLKAWEREGVYLDLALNLPPSTLRNADCAGWVRTALARHEIDPRRLSLEILEDPDVASHATMCETTARLRELGVRLALDDLGAGYSSLLRLNSLPVDMVKVDQGLVYGIVSNNPRA
ncbi:MAG: EAL domain-containing protein, partial [Betaproteobacteria bacterium]|nr:EAL domain-containing protein [Betaproteobacteria bacterium]